MKRTRELALSALLAASLVCVAGTQGFADEPRSREAVITVSGEGRSAIAPDTAILTLAVVKQSKTAQDALAENNKAMGAVLATLKNSGIAERDLQTAGLSIQPQYNFPAANNGQTQPPELIGYQATNTLTVRVRDLSKLGALIDQAVGLGVNQGGDIQFTNDKPGDAIDQARRGAVADALAKANTLTSAAGVKLGRVLEISENSTHPAPVPVFRATMMKAAGDSGVPIQAGENTYNVTVDITYAIVP